MAKFPLPLETFPMLALPAQDAAEIEALSTMLVQKTLAQYHEHAVVNRGVVDELRWKRVRTKDDIRIFKERSRKRHTFVVADEENYGDGVPVLLGVGSIAGDLDDTMYGVLNPTTEAMRIKSTYAEDGFVDGVVLATLVKPSRAEPLRSLTLRWFVKRNPLIIAPVVRMRDVVYIESTGVAATKSGERIGYQLLHSVELPGVRELHDYQLVRANVSFCAIYRQKTPTVVDVFMRGILNPLGDVRPSVSVFSTAEALVSMATNIHVAQMKKLTWLLRSSKTVRRRQSLPMLAVNGGVDSGDDVVSHCRFCLQSMSSTFSLMASTKRSRCAACLETVCSKCRETRKLSFVSPLRQDCAVKQAKFTFCVRCLQTAFSTSALVVALDDIEDSRAALDDDYALLRGLADSFDTPPTSFSSSVASR